MELDKIIRNILKTGKIAFGVNSALNNVKLGKTKLVILASNCPTNKQGIIEYHCQTSNIPLLKSDSSSLDLAIICGKPFAIAALSIRDLGDLEITQIMSEKSLINGGNE